MSQAIDVVREPSVAQASDALQICRPRRQDVVFGNVVLGWDAIVLAASFVAAYSMRDGVAQLGGLLPLRSHLWVLGLSIAIWLPLARTFGLAESRTYMDLGDAATATLNVQAIGGLLLLSTLYLLRATDVSRLFMQAFLVLSGGALVAERVAIRAALTSLARRPSLKRRRMLVIGTTSLAARFNAILNTRPHWSAEIAAFVVVDGPAGTSFCDAPVLGSLHDVPFLLDTMIFDEVILAAPVHEPHRLEALTQACLVRGTAFHTLVRMPTTGQTRHHAASLGDGLYLVSMETTPQSPLALLAKQVVDVVGACVGLAVCAVVFVVFAIPIRLGSRGPVIFKQMRVGQNGRLFTLYKFRTMSVDAEDRKADLMAANEMRGHLFKVRDDPRVTAVGRFLRRTYLDELPQFWNVLRGDMSIVGTRPPTEDEVAYYAPHHRRRLSMRPGITGLWQTTGNGRVTDFEEVVRLDCDYIDRWSIWLDLRILARTWRTVLGMAGH